jgi:hypothetical protein
MAERAGNFNDGSTNKVFEFKNKGSRSVKISIYNTL